MNKKTFEEYLTEFNPNWKQILPLELIVKAKDLYRLKDIYQENNKTIIEKHNYNEDYTDKFLQNTLKLSEVYNKLKSIVSLLTENTVSNERVKLYIKNVSRETL